MPIRGLDQYNNAPSTQKLPISVLNDTMIAIDGFWYLRRYMPAYTSETIFEMKKLLENTIEPLIKFSESANTNVIWIWDGLDFERPKMPEEHSYKAMEAMNRFETNRTVRNIFDQELFVQPVTELLQSQKISVIRSPYLAMAQCVYLLKENCVNYIFTKTDALLFKEGHKVISDINYENKIIEVIDRSELFRMNHFNLQGFQMLSFLSGCEFNPTIPIYAFEFSISNIIKIINDKNIEERLLEYFNKRTSSNIKNIQDEEFKKSEEAEYLKSFYRAFAIVEYHPVMSIDGTVEPMSDGDIPCDLETVFGSRLPDKIYRELYKCNISPKLLSKIILNQKYSEGSKQNLVEIFRSILKNDSHGKDILISEKVKHLLNLKIEVLENINLMAQLIFIYLNRYGDISDNSLLIFLNSYLSDEIQVKPKCTYDYLMCYIEISEIIILFKDIISILRFSEYTKNDLGIKFSFTSLYKNFNKPVLSKFIEMNKVSSSNLIAISEKLKN